MKKICYALLFLCIALTTAAQSDKEFVEETVDSLVIKSHIRFLASDELKGRDTPSEGLNIAARYLANSLLRYGVDTVPGAMGYFQPVKMKAVQPANGTLSMLGQSFKAPGNALVIHGHKGMLQGKTVFVGFGTAKDFEKSNVKGKVVFARAGSGETDSPRAIYQEAQVKRKRAIEHGALALIEFYNSPKMPWKFWKYYLGKTRTQLVESPNNTENTSDSIPHFWIDDSKNGLALVAKKYKEEVRFAITANAEEQFETYNVVGMVEGTDPTLKNEFVIYSAHYDHIGVGQANAQGDSIYNGARDNAVGVVTVLSAAENIAKHPTKRSALFILFAGEEKGLLGSKWYVENPLIPLKQMVFCFNSDNGGYNDTSLATIIGLNRTSAKTHIVEACETFGLSASEDPAPEQGLFDRSDNVNFAIKGIPAPTFCMGFTAFDETILRYYHQPSDHPNTLDYAYLFKFFQSYVLSCRLIANDPETPCWIEGDKHYEAGKALYGE